MRKVRGIIAVVVALILAGVAAYAVYGYLNPPKAPPPAPKPVAEKKTPPPPKPFSHSIEPGMRAVTLAVDEVESGSRDLADGDRVDVLAVTSMPGLPEGRLTRLLVGGARVMTVNRPGENSGRNARQWSVTLAVTPVQTAAISSATPAAKLRLAIRHPDDDDNKPTQVTAFTPNRGVSAYLPQARDLNTMIAPGMRAITVEVVPTDGVGGVFQPGDRVDVVATCPWGNTTSTSEVGAEGTVTETHRNSKILLQNIRILATDRSLVWDSDLNQTADLVTLEVTPADAEKITVLTDSKKGRATIRLISRNQDDHLRVATKGAELLDLISDKIPYKEVETIRGEMKKKETLYK